MADAEKPTFEDPHVEDDEKESIAVDPRIAAFTPEEQKAILFKVDRRLVLTLGFLYMISLVDRTNLGAAAIAG